MAIPRRRRHRFSKKGHGKPRKHREGKKPKPACQDKEPAPENGEAVRHYGDAWDYENYERESHKARGLFL